MKSRLLSVTLFVGICAIATAQVRYLDEIFSQSTVTTDITYAQNYSVLTGSPMLVDLKMDIYEPAGDTVSFRPLIIYLHTGSFLPRYINGLPTGDRNDSATVAMCETWAKKGYVVANIDYRLGWNPAAPDEQDRKESIIRAVYRAMQDAKSCVRYMRMEVATNGNPYRIDESKIVLGGQGTGGYIALAYATLQDVAEIQLLKFFNTNTNAFMVDTAIMGDFEGFGGLPSLNNDNHPGYPTDISMIFNIGGALGDSSWIDQGEVPMCCVHAVFDPFAPYGTGTVFVPGTSFSVVEVSGSSVVTEIANSFGNNDVWLNPPFTDPITMYAMNELAGTANAGNEGLFPINAMQNSSGAWEWWDSTTVVTQAAMLGQNGQDILANGYASNPVYEALGPVAGKARALAYIDTLQQYITPRIYRQLQLNVGIEETDPIAIGLNLYPNPATDNMQVNSENADVLAYEIYDMQGRVLARERVNASQFQLYVGALDRGNYFVSLEFDKGRLVRTIAVE